MARHSAHTSEDQDVKIRLLEAAAALFAEKGYSATSVRAIVDRAGVTKPVLYYYFENKEGIFRALLAQAFERQQENVRRALQSPGSMRDRLLVLYRGFSQNVTEHQNLFRMISTLFLGPPQGAPEEDLSDSVDNLFEGIKKIYLDGLAGGEVIETDPDVLAMLLLSLFHFSILTISPHHYPFKNMAPKMQIEALDLILYGLKRREE